MKRNTEAKQPFISKEKAMLFLGYYADGEALEHSDGQKVSPKYHPFKHKCFKSK